jgi:hypothetical protein
LKTLWIKLSILIYLNTLPAIAHAHTCIFALETIAVAHEVIDLNLRKSQPNQKLRPLSSETQRLELALISEIPLELQSVTALSGGAEGHYYLAQLDGKTVGIKLARGKPHPTGYEAKLQELGATHSTDVGREANTFALLSRLVKKYGVTQLAFPKSIYLDESLGNGVLVREHMNGVQLGSLSLLPSTIEYLTKAQAPVLENFVKAALRDPEIEIYYLAPTANQTKEFKRVDSRTDILDILKLSPIFKDKQTGEIAIIRLNDINNRTVIWGPQGPVFQIYDPF